MFKQFNSLKPFEFPINVFFIIYNINNIIIDNASEELSNLKIRSVAIYSDILFKEYILN